jgi:hypothetical protein
VVLVLSATGMGAVNISGVKGQKKAPCRKARGFIQAFSQKLNCQGL